MGSAARNISNAKSLYDLIRVKNGHKDNWKNLKRDTNVSKNVLKCLSGNFVKIDVIASKCNVSKRQAINAIYTLKGNGFVIHRCRSYYRIGIF